MLIKDLQQSIKNQIFKAIVEGRSQRWWKTLCAIINNITQARTIENELFRLRELNRWLNAGPGEGPFKRFIDERAEDKGVFLMSPAEFRACFGKYSSKVTYLFRGVPVKIRTNKQRRKNKTKV